MAGKLIWRYSWCWRCGNVMTYLLDNDFTARALVDLVIRQPTIFVTLLCYSIFYLCVRGRWWSLYYFPNVIWVDQQACSTGRSVDSD
jgi:hypothetical protein